MIRKLPYFDKDNPQIVQKIKHKWTCRRIPGLLTKRHLHMVLAGFVNKALYTQ